MFDSKHVSIVVHVYKFLNVCVHTMEYLLKIWTSRSNPSISFTISEKNTLHEVKWFDDTPHI